MNGLKKSFAVISLCVLTLFVVGSSVYAEKDSPLSSTQQLKVENVVVDWEGEEMRMHIYGMNFGSEPEVWLEGNSLDGVEVADDGSIDVGVPEWVEPGTYRLYVIGRRLRGIAHPKLVDSMDVTIIAAAAVRAQWAEEAGHAATAGNADTVDGAHASALEETAEIDADIATHAADEDAHHAQVNYAGKRCQPGYSMTGFKDNGDINCVCKKTDDCDGDGYSYNQGDCRDDRADIGPGHTGYMSYAIEGTNDWYDWNCDGVEEKNPAYNKMHQSAGFFICKSGYDDEIPECGKSGEWWSHLGYTPVGLCTWSKHDRTMSCR